MDAAELKEIRDHAWKHFALHADQRLKTLHFYLVLAALVAGATIASVKDLKSPTVGAILAGMLFILSIIFWKLDLRTKDLIQHAELALKFWEEQLSVRDDNNCPH